MTTKHQTKTKTSDVLRGSAAPKQARKRGEANGLASLLFVEALSAVAAITGAIVAVVDSRTMRVLSSCPSPELLELTLIVPARNEASHIGQWVSDALVQTLKPSQIIVADDCSGDATAQQAAYAAGGDSTVLVRNFGEPPPGWIGKTWAAYQAALCSKGSWLLFSDADVRMRADTIASALGAAEEEHADALSLSATLECGTWWERVVMPAIAAIIFSGYPSFVTSDNRFASGLLAGGFLLVKRDAYFLVGGHKAVRDSIAEDRDLAERLKAFGFEIRLVNGSAFVRVRMYSGLAQMWSGWRKNFFEGARRNPLTAIIFVVACIGILVVPMPALLILGIHCLRTRLSPAQGWLAACSASLIGATVVIRLLRDKAIGFDTDFMSVAATPIAGLFAASVMAASAWRVLSGRGQVWKGRTIL